MKQLSDRSKKYLSDFGLLFVAFVWGGGFVAVKDALNEMTPMFLMAIRFTLAAVVLCVFLFKWIGKIALTDLKKGSIVGIFLFLAFASQTIGLQYTTASKQSFLTATYVVMVPFLYWIFYKKSPKAKVFLGSFIAFVGIGMISLNEGLALNKGDVLTLVCALFFAIHILSIEYYAKDMGTIKLAFIQISTAAVLFIIAAFVFEPIPVAISTRTWIAIAYSAVFSTFLCFTVQTIAQRYTSSSHVSLILSLESVFGALLGVWLLNEVLTPIMLVGCALIFIAIVYIELDVST